MSAGTVEQSTIEDFVPLFKTLSNSTRARIVELLISGERCPCEMTGPLGLSQPLISHHLGMLKDAGFVTSRDEGARTYYFLAWERFAGDLRAFQDYTERLHSSPPRTQPSRRSAGAQLHVMKRRTRGDSNEA